jgi:hypothetical protein
MLIDKIKNKFQVQKSSRFCDLLERACKLLGVRALLCYLGLKPILDKIVRFQKLVTLIAL